MNGQFQERRIFPSGDFDRLPTIGAPRRRRRLTLDRIACAALGASVVAVLELILG